VDCDRLKGGMDMEQIDELMNVVGENTPIPDGQIYDDKMTIYYRKKTGEIKELMSGECDMSVFGAEQEDYELIWDFIVVEIDDYVRNNRQLFSVDLETKELIFVPSVVTTKYKTKE
jgi:hypothetical protein